MKTLDIGQHYFVRAAPSKVFRALTDSPILVRWFLASALIQPEAGTSETFR